MPTTTRRRWFQVGLKSLLAFVTLVAIVAAWIAHERNQSQRELQIAEHLQTIGAFGTSVRFAGPFDDPKIAREEQSWWRKELEGLLGVRVQRLDLRGPEVSDASSLAGLTNLQTLGLWDTRVSSLTPLSGLTKCLENNNLFNLCGN